MLRLFVLEVVVCHFKVEISCESITYGSMRREPL